MATPRCLLCGGEIRVDISLCPACEDIRSAMSEDNRNAIVQRIERYEEALRMLRRKPKVS